MIWGLCHYLKNVEVKGLQKKVNCRSCSKDKKRTDKTLLKNNYYEKEQDKYSLNTCIHLLCAEMDHDLQRNPTNPIFVC